MPGGSADRRRIPFRAVNRRGQPGYQCGMQRHHLLPRELLSRHYFVAMFDAVGRDRLGFHDFRCNGLLLPSSGEMAVRMALPLHRGPHRTYNALVAERVGQIESTWSTLRSKAPEPARDQAFMRLTLLKRALRRRLLRPDRPRLRLNRQDPLGASLDFAEIDAMAEMLWAGTTSVNVPQ
jgi:hypothetical protein